MKRFLDIVLACIFLSAALPVLVVISLIIRIRLGSPVFYLQERIGHDSKPFTLIKFRTMQDIRDEAGEPLPDSKRITGVGAFLRQTSLDELPEFWNVLVGEMSLVGPRPLLPRYLPYYTEEECKRHDVRPGITGLAQVSGRNFLSWDDRLALDVEYVENQTLKLDLILLWLTLRKVIIREGVAVDTEPTMQDLDDERKNKRYVS